MKFYIWNTFLPGDLHHHGFDYEQDYLTDLVANDSIAFIQRHLTDQRTSTKPFLAVLSFPAPHGPEDPAPQYSQVSLVFVSH